MFRTSGTGGVHRAGCSKMPIRKAAASEEARRKIWYVEPLSEARTPLVDFFSILLDDRSINMYQRNGSSQRMVFTISLNGLVDHGQLLSEILPADSLCHELTKIIIPVSVKSQFMRRLREMNVTARTLFPGVDGIGRSVAELAKITSEWFRGQNNAKIWSLTMTHASCKTSRRNMSHDLTSNPSARHHLSSDCSKRRPSGLHGALIARRTYLCTLSDSSD